MCLFVLQKSGEYSKVFANPLPKSGEYSEVFALLAKNGEYSHVSASSLQNSGEYSNACASPLQRSGEYSKVLSVCVFACSFVFYKKAVNIRRSSLTHYEKSDEYSKVFAFLTKT